MQSYHGGRLLYEKVMPLIYGDYSGSEDKLRTTKLLSSFSCLHLNYKRISLISLDCCWLVSTCIFPQRCQISMLNVGVTLQEVHVDIVTSFWVTGCSKVV